MKRVTTGQPRPIRGFRTGPGPDPTGSRAQRRLAAKLGAKPHLRDAATICAAVLAVPGDPLRCELDDGHDGKHRHGCTGWAA